MNHGPAFQALWSRLRVEVRQLQDRGYYGDGQPPSHIDTKFNTDEIFLQKAIGPLAQDFETLLMLEEKASKKGISRNIWFAFKAFASLQLSNISL